MEVGMVEIMQFIFAIGFVYIVYMYFVDLGDRSDHIKKYGTKTCPACKSEIHPEAEICKYCLTRQ